MMIGRILEGVFSRVGVHTNPYLQVPGEKFLINGRMISASRFTELTGTLKEKYVYFQKQNPEAMLRYGEMWVVLYNLYFAESNLDWGVIETGMGGRFDPTNVLMPELSVITNVDFDHVPQLGVDLAEIAWHKAGIIKPGRPVITSEQKEEALSVIHQEAGQKRSKLYCLEVDFSWEVVSKDNKGTVINVAAPYPQKMSALANVMGELYPGKKFTLICGMLETKDALLSIKSLLPQATRVITAKPQVVGKPGIKASKLAQMIKTIGYGGRLDVCPDVRQAIETALKEAKPDDVILITGSLYMLGEARSHWVKPEELLLKAELHDQKF